MSLNERKGRATILINPNFQLSFLGFTIAMSLLSIATFFVANYVFFMQFKALGKSAGLAADHVLFQFLSTQESSMRLVYVITAIVNVTILSVSGLIFSHRVAGPIYRIQNHFDKLANDPSLAANEEVHLRKKDYFPELAESINRFLKARK